MSKYRCTECDGDAFVGICGWESKDEVLITKNERLCLSCFKIRTGTDFTFFNEVVEASKNNTPMTISRLEDNRELRSPQGDKGGEGGK